MLLSWEMNTYGAGPLFGPAGSGDRTKSGSRRRTRAGLPSFGALRRDKTPTAALWLYCVLARERESSVVSNESNLLYVAHGPPFIGSRGHRQVATHVGVKV